MAGNIGIANGLRVARRLEPQRMVRGHVSFAARDLGFTEKPAQDSSSQRNVVLDRSLAASNSTPTRRDKLRIVRLRVLVYRDTATQY